MRVCSDKRPPKRRTKYSPRQQTIPQTSALPRIITRAIRFGHEAGEISIGKDTGLQDKPIFKPIPARKSTQSVLSRGGGRQGGAAAPPRDNIGATG